MREVTRIVYEAFDGEMFDSEAKCAAYEKDNAWRKLIGLSEADVAAALSNGTGELAEALVTIGYRLANMNRGKRAPKPNPADKEPYLPHPVGPDEQEPPEPPMTAEEALNHTL